MRLLLALLLLAATPAFAQTTSTTMNVRDGAGATQKLRADQNTDGSLATHSVPEVNGAAVSAANPLATQDVNGGAAGTGITQPTGGAGILGWLSGIYQALTGTLAVSQTGALPAGSNTIGAANALPPALTGQGKMTVTNTSQTVSAANVTLAPGSAAFPTGALPTGQLSIENDNTSTANLAICWHGGPCTTAAGITSAVGERRDHTLPSFSTSPPAVICAAASSCTVDVEW